MAWSQPDLFVLGAAKCGTSTLHALLDLHPDIEMSRNKEPGFFSFRWSQEPEAQASYLENWQRLGDAALAGEASVTYFTHPDAAARIVATVERPRAIVLLRDPVERAISNHLHTTTKEGPHTREGEPFHKAVRSELDRIDEVSPDGLRRSYVRTGLYGGHLRRALDAFGRDHVFVGLTADMQSDPAKFLTSLAAWLGVDPTPWRSVAPVHRNVALAPRGRLGRWLLASPALRASKLLHLFPERLRTAVAKRFLLKRGGHPSIDDATRLWLQERFEPEIQEVEALLGRPLPELRRTWITEAGP